MRAENPRQLFTNCDLMAGLALILSWMIRHERVDLSLRVIARAILFLWGNVAVGAYIFLCGLSRGRADALLMGRRAADLAQTEKPGRVVRILCLASAALAVASAIRLHLDR